MQIWLKCNNPPAFFMFTEVLRGSAFADLDESIDYGWKSESRAGGKRFSQATEAPHSTISISGRYCPLYHQISTKEALKALAGLQIPLDMIDSDGSYDGQVIITKLSFKNHRFVGGTPLVVDFTMELQEYVE